MSRFQMRQSKTCRPKVDMPIEMNVAIAAPTRPIPSPDSGMKSKFKGTAKATIAQLMATIFLKWLD